MANRFNIYTAKEIFCQDFVMLLADGWYKNLGACHVDVKLSVKIFQNAKTEILRLRI